MKFPTFAEYVTAREGVRWAIRPPLTRMSRINTTPLTLARRKRMWTRAKPAPDDFAPTVQAVAPVVPRHLIPRLKKEVLELAAALAVWISQMRATW